MKEERKLIHKIATAQAQARLAWNTRAPILSESEMEMLDEH